MSDIIKTHFGDILYENEFFRRPKYSLITRDEFPKQ
jgi:hypothetical protein